MNCEHLRPADIVGISPEFDNENRFFKFSEVERITKTQIILTNGTRYNKRNGIRIGDNDRWFKEQLVPKEQAERVNEQRAEGIAHRKAKSDLHKLADHACRYLSREALEEINELIQKHRKQENT